MCCLFTTLLLLGPRFVNIIWWIAQPTRWVGSTNLSAFTSWIWPALGIVFLPWTTLMYVLLAPAGISGLTWIWIGLAVVADIASYTGGAYGNRKRLGYSQ